MKFKARLMAVILLSMSSLALADTPIKLEGAGATFPATLYKKWLENYKKVAPATFIRYDAVGSGEGVSRFLADRVDFGASDTPLSVAHTQQAKHGAVSVPVTAGMIVLAYNLAGLNGPLKLSRETYIDLLMGKIPRWNDARIQKTNPGLNLPADDIVLVLRHDSSGTTEALTKHLDAVSPKWRKEGPGVGKLVTWPAQSMLVNGNESVAARIKLSVGAVGYVEYSFAKQLNLPMAQLENKAGNFIAPSNEVGINTLAANPAQNEQSLREVLTDPAGAQSYPMISYSWLLLKKNYADTAKSAALKRFVTWGLESGQDSATNAGYLRLPSNVSQISKDLLDQVR